MTSPLHVHFERKGSDLRRPTYQYANAWPYQSCMCSMFLSAMTVLLTAKLF